VIAVRGDITEPDAWEGVPTGFWRAPESTVLFHLAGLAHAGECRQHPSRSAAVNVMGVVKVVEVCRRQGVRRVVFPSTALVYGPKAKLPACESDMPCPASVYAATKMAAEGLLQGYAGEFAMSCDVARLGNVYGWGAAADTVHSILLRQAFRREPLSVRTLKPIRDFVYVKDVAEGLIRLARSGEAAGFRVFNLASGQATSIGELARTICRVAGLPDDIRETEPDARAHASGRSAASALVLCVDKLARQVGWRPAWSLEAGIRDVLEQMRRDQCG
jgi:nucleoside-diphosphate-sugar epimerase